MEKLIAKIKELIEDPAFPLEEDGKLYLTNGAQDELPLLIQEIESEACGELISSGGNPHYGKMEILEKAIPGVLVVKGESDSFGWLSGVIVTPKGRIVYG